MEEKRRKRVGRGGGEDIIRRNKRSRCGRKKNMSWMRMRYKNRMNKRNKGVGVEKE
jgi:hypothetical protein